MQRVTDWISDYIYSLGVSEVFMVTGGGMMFLSDGVAKHPRVHGVCVHHEQAAAMAATAYAKYKEGFGAAYLTTGCGGTNAITGLLGAWQDSASCLFVSGQAKRKETTRNSGLPLRQFGVQEADIIAIVESITKYAVMVNEPEDIAYHFTKAAHLARTGRPGPVWIDVPLDVQGAIIDETKLRRYDPQEEEKNYQETPGDDEMAQLAELLSKAERPCIVAGQGIRLSKGIDPFKQLVERLQIPVVVSRLGIDALPSAHPLFIGQIGTKGNRPGNFAVQNADLVLAIGSRLSVSSTGHEYHQFARAAKHVVVDIDPIEHQKNTVSIDLFINADARKFLEGTGDFTTRDTTAWVKKCGEWKTKYPACLPEYAQETGGINLYYFIDRLSAKMPSDATLVADAGSAFYVCSQGVQIKDEQRHIVTGGQAEMGNTLPAAIGACVARGNREVLGVTGDGSFQMNIQELQTLVHHQLPVKLFVWNNDGYLSIRATQGKFFEGRFIGTDSESGLSFPDTEKIAHAYGLKYFKAASSADLDGVLDQVLAYDGPVLCEIMCLRDQEIVPSVASKRLPSGQMVSRPLEDMYPFLDRDVFRNEMIVPPLEEDDN
jgi:acetolactate synthase I/II/III large subunit